LGSTVNFEIPGALIGPNSEYSVEVLEVQPCAAIEGEEAGARFPQVGRVNFAARVTGPTKVMLVPVRYDADGSGRLPDLSDEHVEEMRQLLASQFPVTDAIFTIREPVGTTQTDLGSMLNQMMSLRSNDGPPGDVSYYGLVRQAETFRDYCNGSCVTGIASFARGSDGGSGMGIGYTGYAGETFVHEMGHIYQRPHSPCGGPANPDPQFPYSEGSIGSWGYDRIAGELIDPADGYKDLMGYCGPVWISDYVYQLLVDRVAVLNDNERVVTLDATPRNYWTLLIDPAQKGRWGLPLSLSGAPAGDRETATVVDDAGQPLLQIPVYRVELGDSGEQLVYVPEPHGGWHSVVLGSGLVHGFSEPLTVSPFSE
jgi:hypothetical protein